MRLAAKIAVVSVILVGALTISATREAVPLFLNTTPSEPEGLYAVISHHPKQLTLGEYVAACPPMNMNTATAKARGYLASGTCPGDMVPVLKQVEALPGDIVETSAVGVIVNGNILPRTAPLHFDEKGRVLVHYPYGIYHVPAGKVWLLSTYAADSYDARYFGPVSTNAVRATVKPIWIRQ